MALVDVAAGRSDARRDARGASVVVVRLNGGDAQYLLLHRAGAPEAGDWAWTPLSGVVEPGESAKACARRELAEETGLVLACIPTAFGGDDWPVFFALAPGDGPIHLSAEHDRYEWLSAEDAVARCQPAAVADAVRRVATLIGQRG